MHIGLFLEPDKDNQLRLPLIIDGDISDVTYVNLGPIKIGGPPSNVLALDVTPQHPRDDKLSDLIKLNGYDLAYLPDAQELHLTLFWESISVTERNYKTFVHLQDESGQIVAQKDVEPANGVYPTSLWDANEVVKDEIVFSLPSGLSRSNYRLSIGMYDFSTGERLHVPNSPDNTILLATFDTTNLTFQRYEN